MAHLPSRFVPFAAAAEAAEAAEAAAGAAAPASERPVRGTLEVELHHARDLHNICIYQKQDVYAKLSIFRDGVETAAFKTSVVLQGGKDPVFNHKFSSSVITSDSVLRCEVYMCSKMKDYLPDQQLGLVLVPLSRLLGRKKQLLEYQLSATELFHSPAGALYMTLEFRGEATEATGTTNALNLTAQSDGSCGNGSCTSDLSACSEGEGFSSAAVQFTDLDSAREDQQLVSEFITSGAATGQSASREGILTGPPYLAQQERTQVEEEEEPAVAETDTKVQGVVRISLQQAELIVDADESSIVLQQEEITDAKQVLAEDAAGGKKMKQLEVAVSTGSSSFADASSVTPSSRLKAAEDQEKQATSEEEELGKLAVPRLIPEPRIKQEEIVGMYMKSMQQFSEALAKMQLPLVDEKNSGSPGETDQQTGSSSRDSGNASDDKKSSGKVFYGSRAFF